MLVLINWKNLADKKKDLAVLISILMYKMFYLASKTFLTITDEEIDSIQNELAKKKNDYSLTTCSFLSKGDIVKKKNKCQDIRYNLLKYNIINHVK